MLPIRFPDRHLRADRPAFGAIINFDSVNLVEFVALAGFDFVLLDAEHGPLTPESAQGMIRTANAMGLSAFVRTPDRTASEMQRYLDVGAHGIQAPMVETSEQARTTVQQVLYPPRGQRGLSMSTPAAAYGSSESAADYIARANGAVSAFATVESRAGVGNIDGIIAESGLSGICIGTGDLALSLGFPGQRSAPEVQASVRRIVGACRAAGKQVMLPATDASSIRAAVKLGVTGIQVPAASLVIDRCRQLIGEVTHGRPST